MSIDKFRFVSPGVFVNEIDNTLLPRTSEEMGPVIVGTAERGPMMRPMKIQSFSDFAEVFGAPLPGGQGGDVWRNGNKTVPTYGAYAAKAYLKNSGPVTFLRLGGYENPLADSSYAESKAGWSAKKAYGLFVVPISKSSNDVYDVGYNGSSKNAMSLGAIIYTTNTDVTLGLYGRYLSGSSYNASTGETGSVIRAGDSIETTLVFNKNGKSSTYSFNFNEDSKKYIRNVLNTNPILTNQNLTENPEDYFLGESFQSFIKTVNNGISGDFACALLELGTSSATGVSYTNFNKPATYAETPWIYSQDFGKYSEFAPNSDGVYENVIKLFKIVSLTEGSWNSQNLKISIEDITPSRNIFYKYGTFTVSVRKLDDSDANPVYLERFTNVTLDPFSPNYIAKKIGDKYTEWDYEQKRYREYNQYQNLSKFIRVEVETDVASAQTDAGALPYGFYLNNVFLTDQNKCGSRTPTTLSVTSSISPNSVLKVNSFFTASIAMPYYPVLSSSVDAPVVSLNNIYWGFKTNVLNTKKHNKDIGDYLRVLPVRTISAAASSSFFTLDDISASVTYSNGSYKLLNKEAKWSIGNRKNNVSLSSNEYTAANGTLLLLDVFNKFNIPLVGGSDGVDITEKDPFNRRVLKGKEETTSYAFNSVKVAIEAITDPDVIEGNLATAPGIENPQLTSLLLERCESRADMLAIIDLEGDYIPEEGRDKVTDTIKERKPNVDTAVKNLKERFINNSYGCSFFPWVLIRDEAANNNTLWVPPSVAALGTFSSSQQRTELWFAPAGFNRGGLSDGAAGIPVVQTSLRLTSKNRDELYANNINPIATFPSEGIVVFGQKTLQVTQSALDRINVRRLMIYIKKEISRMATTVLFDPNVEVTWKRFTDLANPFLTSVKSRFGVTDFKVVLDSTTTTPDLIDRNIVYAKVMIKPTRSIEFIAIDFVLANSGASFED